MGVIKVTSEPIRRKDYTCYKSQVSNSRWAEVNRGRVYRLTQCLFVFNQICLPSTKLVVCWVVSVEPVGFSLVVLLV